MHSHRLLGAGAQRAGEYRVAQAARGWRCPDSAQAAPAPSNVSLKRILENDQKMLKQWKRARRMGGATGARHRLLRALRAAAAAGATGAPAALRRLRVPGAHQHAAARAADPHGEQLPLLSAGGGARPLRNVLRLPARRCLRRGICCRTACSPAKAPRTGGHQRRSAEAADGCARMQRSRGRWGPEAA